MKYVNKLTPRLVPGRNGPKRRGRGRIPDEPIFLRQGDLDGACGYYCLLMALIALGLFRRSEVLDLDVRKPVKALARIRASARPHYFSGTGTKTLQKLLSPVKDALQVGITNGKDNKVRDFVVEHLARGDFVVLGMENVRQELAHWVLAVGMSGTRTRGEFKPTRFLLLDPDVNGPGVSAGTAQSTCRPPPRTVNYGACAKSKADNGWRVSMVRLRSASKMKPSADSGRFGILRRRRMLRWLRAVFSAG